MGWRKSRRVSLVAATALTLSSCATTSIPRAYLPVMQPAPADPTAFKRIFGECATQVSADAAVFYRRSPPTLKQEDADDSSGFSGPGAIGPGDMGSGAFMLGVLLIGGAVQGVRSRARSAQRKATEHEIQAAMTSCLAQRGYTVTAWERVKGRRFSTSRLQTPISPPLHSRLLYEAEYWEGRAETSSDRKARARFVDKAAESYEYLALSGIVQDPGERAKYIEKAASLYELHAQSVSNPKDRAKYLEMAERTRRKAHAPFSPWESVPGAAAPPPTLPPAPKPPE